MRHDMVFGLKEIEAVIVECGICNSEIRFDMNKGPDAARAQKNNPNYVQGTCPVCGHYIETEDSRVENFIKMLLDCNKASDLKLSLAVPLKTDSRKERSE